MCANLKNTRRKREVTIVFTVVHVFNLPQPMESSGDSIAVGVEDSPLLLGFLLPQLL